MHLSITLVEQYHHCLLIGVEHLLVAFVTIYTWMSTNEVFITIVEMIAMVGLNYSGKEGQLGYHLKVYTIINQLKMISQFL